MPSKYQNVFMNDDEEKDVTIPHRDHKSDPIRGPMFWLHENERVNLD